MTPADGNSESSSQEPLAAEEMLPPVQPPAAGFILQLFVVPTLIVLVILLFWLWFTWLARGSSTHPEELIKGLQSEGIERWQSASELADVLRSNRYDEFKANQQAAGQLAQMLDREIDAGDADAYMKDGPIRLRRYLCRALGEFHVDAGLPVLLKAAKTDRDPREEIVQRGAIEAIAILAHNFQQLQPPQQLEHPELESTLLTLSQDDSRLIRSEAAYALGVLGTPTAIERLEALLEDVYPDTRYNAALALSRHGNTEALPVIAEMLDPEESASIAHEEDLQAQQYKRSVIMTNALAAVRQLAASDNGADFSQVITALEKLTNADADLLDAAHISPEAVDEAKRTLGIVQHKSSEP